MPLNRSWSRLSSLAVGSLFAFTLLASPASAQIEAAGFSLGSALQQEGEERPFTPADYTASRITVQSLLGIVGTAGGALFGMVGWSCLASPSPLAYCHPVAFAGLVLGMAVGGSAGVTLGSRLFGVEGSFWHTLLGASLAGALVGLIHLYLLPIGALVPLAPLVGAMFGHEVSRPTQPGSSTGPSVQLQWRF